VRGLLVGAGTLFHVENEQRCLDAGAAFLTTPALDMEIVNFAIGRGVAVLPGALTPTEIVAAWKAGSDLPFADIPFGLRARRTLAQHLKRCPRACTAQRRVDSPPGSSPPPIHSS
jgi:hypothetical protein